MSQTRTRRKTSGAEPAPQAEPAGPPEGTGSQARALPQLPTTRDEGIKPLEEKTVLIYGPRGIGKSTAASGWGPEVLMFDTAGELDGIPGYKHPVSEWEDFRLACAALVASDGRYSAVAVDTADMLGSMCAAYTNAKLGIPHASDAEWGKGWDAVRSEFLLRLAKLAALPKCGLILVSHSKEVEIKTRTAAYSKAVPTLTGGVREACVGMADLVLYVGYSEDEESEERVVFTKPTRYHEAKERGASPRLPAEIKWPLGESLFDIIKKEWDRG